MGRKPSKGNSHGLIIGKFLPPHAGHLYLIGEARKQVDQLTVLVCSLAAEPIAGVLRYEWMQALCPDCRVLHHTAENPSYPHEHPDFWQIWTESIRALVPEPISQVFSSEAYGERLAACFGARSIFIDLHRKAFPVSGTAIRENPYANWDFLPPLIRAHYVKRVALLGAESTGKTTLAQALAQTYQTVWVPEYGRAFVERQGRLPEAHEMLSIAQKQVDWEAEACQRAYKILFADTTPLTTALYADYYFGAAEPALWRLAETHAYDLILVTEDDIPWVADGLQRDGETVRYALQKRFKQKLTDLQLPFHLVKGDLETRLQTAIQCIGEVLYLFK